MARVLHGGGGFSSMEPLFYPYSILEFNMIRGNLPERRLLAFTISRCNHTIIAFSND